MTPEQWAAIIAAIGLPLVVKELVAGWRAMTSGRARSERSRNRKILEAAARAEEKRDAAEARADHEAARRRAWEEYAGELRWLLLQCGMPADKVPPWPDPE